MCGRQSCCTFELDVQAPAGVLNHEEYASLVRRAGSDPTARAQAALHARLSIPGTLDKPGLGGGEAASAPGPSARRGAGRPTPGARTTGLEARRGIQGWLRGGPPPGRAPWALGDARWVAAPVARDIEDLAGAEPAETRRARSPAGYSDPADRPSRAGMAFGGKRGDQLSPPRPIRWGVEGGACGAAAAAGGGDRVSGIGAIHV